MSDVIFLQDARAQLTAMKGNFYGHQISDRQQIEQQVEDLLVEHGVTSVPVPVEAIARAEGLPIVETDMEADVSGALIKSGNLHGIAVNASQAPVRKRFTVAHELAHHLLSHVAEDHLDWQFTVIRRDGRSSDATDYKEIEAKFLCCEPTYAKTDITGRRGEKEAL